MKVKLNELLKQKRISVYRLAGHTKIDYQGLLKLAAGKKSSITFNVLDRLCKALDCQPSDIIESV
jgi:putative transcriptional regulator